MITPKELRDELRAAPLRFERVCLEKVWGGRALESALGIHLPGHGPIGETWELVDREKEQSIVADGPLAGATLGELVRDAGEALLGDARPTPEGRFPLLVKFLDASAPLSVQVHPDEEGARRQGGGSEPKTEAWYFLRDGGEVWCGLRDGVDRARFEAALDAGKPSELLASHAVRGGDALVVRGGTVHAIGAGVTLLEVQQNSDTTYRLDDWGRVGLDGLPRDLHRAQGLEVTRFGEPAPAPAAPVWRDAGPGVRSAALGATPWFELEALELDGQAARTTKGRFQAYVCVRGTAILFAPFGGRTTHLATGDVVLVPAVLGDHRLAPGSDTARLVRLGVPA
ncbi:MAG: type I phosphomannose isomerase catalytic subunit [Planctomycetota bacterium]